MLNKIAAALLVSGLLGCTSGYKHANDQQASVRDDMGDKLQRDSVVVVHKESYGGLKRISKADQPKLQNAWLKAIRITLDIKEPISATEIVRMLKKQGINITTATELENHTYSGFGVRNVDGETGLNLLLGSMGLDYTINSEGRYVTITPLGSRTYYLNLGNRQATFGGGSNSGGSSGGAGGSANASGGAGGGASGGGSQTNSITVSDNFWRSLSTEITQRLTVLTPNSAAMKSGLAIAPILPDPSQLHTLPLDFTGKSAPLPDDRSNKTSSQNIDGVGEPAIPLPNGRSNRATSAAIENSGSAAGPGAGSSGSAAGNLYKEQKMGNFTTNPETGAVTIRAPRWLLDSFTDYFQRINDQYNTVVEFDCEIVQLTTKLETLEGLDISAFASFMHGQYGAAITNNALGGVNVSLPTATKALATTVGAALPGAVPIIGVVSAANKLQIFNAYLSNLGHIDIIQKPVIVTSSGVPGEFTKTETRYYNSLQQTAASGGVGGGGTTATQNQLVPFETGNTLRIFPHYDPTNGLVRAQISLNQAIQTGTQTQVQYLTAGTSQQQVDTLIPIISNQHYSGETLLRDGDLVVVGGQVEDSSNINHSGVTGLMDLEAVSGIFGKKNIVKSHTTYYFALHVRVRSRKTL